MGYFVTAVVCLLVGAVSGFIFKTFLVIKAQAALNKVSK